MMGEFVNWKMKLEKFYRLQIREQTVKNMKRRVQVSEETVRKSTSLEFQTKIAEVTQGKQY